MSGKKKAAPKAGIVDDIEKGIGGVADFFTGTTRYNTKDAPLGSAPEIRQRKQKDKDDMRMRDIEQGRKTPAQKKGGSSKMPARVARY